MPTLLVLPPKIADKEVGVLTHIVFLLSFISYRFLLSYSFLDRFAFNVHWCHNAQTALNCMHFPFIAMWAFYSLMHYVCDLLLFFILLSVFHLLYLNTDSNCHRILIINLKYHFLGKLFQKQCFPTYINRSVFSHKAFLFIIFLIALYHFKMQVLSLL